MWMERLELDTASLMARGLSPGIPRNPPGTDPLTALVNMLSFNGTPGTDFSTALGGPNTQITALDTPGAPATTMTVTAISDGTDGNSIATTIGSGSHFSWGHTTLTGGGVHALHGIDMPNGDPAGVTWDVNSYNMVAKAGSNKFYFINPGDTTMDALQFMTKESAPDPIVEALTAGDVFLLFGSEFTRDVVRHRRPQYAVRSPRGAVACRAARCPAPLCSWATASYMSDQTVSCIRRLDQPTAAAPTA